MGKYYYHGTTLDKLPDLIKLGLVPSSVHHKAVNYPTLARKDVVYLTRTPSASEWGIVQSEDKKIPIVLRVNIPASQKDMIEVDPNWSSDPDELEFSDWFITPKLFHPTKVEYSFVTGNPDDLSWHPLTEFSDIPLYIPKGYRNIIHNPAIDNALRLV